MCWRRLWRRASLSIEASSRIMRGGSIYQELWEIVERGLWKWSHWGTWKGAHLPGTWEMRKVGSRNGVSLYEEALWGEHGGKSPFWDPGEYIKEGSGEGYLSSKEPRWGTWKGACIPGILKDERRRDLEMGHRCLRELYDGNMEGGLLYWGPWRIR
jgi:hypothetical protein